VKHWTPTTLLVRLIKTGAQAAHHAWYVMFQMVGVAVPRKVLAAILARYTMLGRRGTSRAGNGVDVIIRPYSKI